jgi:RNA polymerase sigma-70 factor (ECF subfamily)
MAAVAAAERAFDGMGDRELAGRIAGGDRAAFTFLIRRSNQRLFRAAWAVLKNRHDAEEVVQAGYLKAFFAMGRFDAASSLATWLTRIVVNEAISHGRASRRRKRSLGDQGLAVLEDWRERLRATPSLSAAPEDALMRRQLAQILESAIARLPDTFRLVFVLHEVEGLTTEEVAAATGVQVGTVRTRLFRARRQLREDLGPEMRRALESTVAFAGADCDALTAKVLAALEQRTPPAAG